MFTLLTAAFLATVPVKQQATTADSLQLNEVRKIKLELELAQAVRNQEVGSALLITGTVLGVAGFLVGALGGAFAWLIGGPLFLAGTIPFVIGLPVAVHASSRRKSIEQELRLFEPPPPTGPQLSLSFSF